MVPGPITCGVLARRIAAVPPRSPLTNTVAWNFSEKPELVKVTLNGSTCGVPSITVEGPVVLIAANPSALHGSASRQTTPNRTREPERATRGREILTPPNLTARVAAAQASGGLRQKVVGEHIARPWRGRDQVALSHPICVDAPLRRVHEAMGLTGRSGE